MPYDRQVTLTDRIEQAIAHNPADPYPTGELQQLLRACLSEITHLRSTLTRAGWTLTPGALEWKPPLGPSASPLLDEIERLREENARLRADTVITREMAGFREIKQSIEEKKR